MGSGEIFALVMVGIFVLMVVFIILLGIFYPGTGADQLGWRPTRTPEQDAANEVDDVAQMLEATNERRRRTGRPELTEEQVRGEVEKELLEQQERQDRLRKEEWRES